MSPPKVLAPPWCEIPRLGEAERPGPLTTFDDPELDDWIDYEGSEPEWEEDVCELALSCLPSDPDEPDPPTAQPTDRPVHHSEFNANLSGAEAWLRKNAHRSFVPVRCKKLSKTSKFEGERPGWVFKLGGAGLGYYRDVGYVHTVRLHAAVVPGGSTVPIRVSLNDVVSSSEQGSSRSSSTRAAAEQEQKQQREQQHESSSRQEQQHEH